MPAKKTKVINPPPKSKVVTPPTAKKAALAVVPTKNGPVKLLCKLHHAWGSTVTVDEVSVKIDEKDGSLVVDQATATTLLANADKYALYVPGTKVPTKRPSFAEANPGVPNAVLIDPRTGRVLDDDEALRVLGQSDQTVREGVVSGKRAEESSDPLTAIAKDIASRPAPKTVMAKVIRTTEGDDDTLTRDEQIRIEDARIKLEQAADAAAMPAAPVEVVEEDWPAASMRDSLETLNGVLDRLVKAGGLAQRPASVTKKEALDLIEKGYAHLTEIQE